MGGVSPETRWASYKCEMKFWYMVRQFNFRNGPVKAKFVYLCTNEETHKHGLDLRSRHACFFGRCEFCVFHCILCRFCFESYSKHYVSSPVMTLRNISALRKRSDEMWSRRCIWSCFKIRGTIFAEKFLLPKSYFTICRTVSLFIFSSAVALTPDLRTKVRTLSTFASVLWVFGCPLLGSSCTPSRLFLNPLCHSKTLDFFIAYSP